MRQRPAAGGRLLVGERAEPNEVVDPIDIRLADPSYEDDFWSKPGYAGINPPNYLKAAKVDGGATITADSSFYEFGTGGAPASIQGYKGAKIVFHTAKFVEINLLGNTATSFIDKSSKCIR